MVRVAALLRGINVGGHRVKMDHLRELFRELDLADVETLIASGNVFFSPEGSGSSDSSGTAISSATADAFEPSALERQIESHLEARLGYEVPTFIRTRADLAAVVAFADQLAADASHSEGEGSCYVIFFREPVDDATWQRFADASSDEDDFRRVNREVYWKLPGKLSESPLFGREFDRMTKALLTTTRNITTVRRMLDKLAG